MASYLQMGHNSEIFLREEGLSLFSGVLLSPVNRNKNDLRKNVGESRTQRPTLDIILDPQLYCPRSEYGHLPTHDYFPNDFETADLSSDGWWQNLANEVAEYGADLNVNGICSPIALPKKWSMEYFARCSETYSILAARLANKAPRAIMSLCVNLGDLSSADDALRIASAVTSNSPKWCYLVVVVELEPRREISDSENLFSLMILVAALEKSGCKTLVSHTSSDMVLMKAAGASHCSTGNFFNLRRFSRNRFEESEEGGRQISYWFEHSLMGFIREADIAQLRRSGKFELLQSGDSDNQFARAILEQFVSDPGHAWLGLGWRQFLYWFTSTEKKLSCLDPGGIVGGWLREAEKHWLELDDEDILLQESRNDGSWIRPWRQALANFKKRGL